MRAHRCRSSWQPTPKHGMELDSVAPLAAHLAPLVGRGTVSARNVSPSGGALDAAIGGVPGAAERWELARAPARTARSRP